MINRLSQFVGASPAWWRALLVVCIVSTLNAASDVQSVNAAPCDAPISNPIPCENSQPGTPQTQWDIGASGIGDPTILGFTTDISYNKGDTVVFKVSTPASAYRLDIYRMGYYQGNGAR